MDEDIKIKIGQVLLSLRKKNGYSQAEVAEYLGITTAAYQNYEAGRREANYTNIHKLADFYGVTTDYLLGREPAPDPFAELNFSEEDEKEVVEKYMSLPPEVRAMMLDVIKQLGSVMLDETTEEKAEIQKRTRHEMTVGDWQDMKEANEQAEKDAG